MVQGLRFFRGQSYQPLVQEVNGLKFVVLHHVVLQKHCLDPRHQAGSVPAPVQNPEFPNPELYPELEGCSVLLDVLLSFLKFFLCYKQL